LAESAWKARETGLKGGLVRLEEKVKSGKAGKGKRGRIKRPGTAGSRALILLPFSWGGGVL
jgi:hypothetical protein